jgi:AcrR family transcriptional regulator
LGRIKTISDDDILAHARDVFRAGGHAASTREVARAAGISQAVLYQRFGSKEALFTRAMTPESPDLEELLGLYPPRSARADLKRIANRIAGYLVSLTPTLLHVLAHPDLDRSHLVHWHEQLPFHALLHALTARFRKLSQDGLIGPVNASSAAKALLAAAHSASLVHALSGNSELETLLDQVDGMVEIMWSGFAPTPERSP